MRRLLVFAALLAAAPLQAQTPPITLIELDSMRAVFVSALGFSRASETELLKAIARLDSLRARFVAVPPPAPTPTPTPAPTPVPAPTGEVGSTDFETGSSAPFAAANGSTTGNATINIIADPTGAFGGKVARMRYASGANDGQKDVNVKLNLTATTGYGYGQTFFIYGEFFIPTPAANMVDAQRKLFYIQRQSDTGNGFIFLKAEDDIAGGQPMKFELPKAPTGNRVISAGTISFDTKTELEIQITVNSAPGVADGIVRMWKNRQLIVDQTNCLLLRSGTVRFTRFLFGDQTQALFAADIAFDEYRYWDNLAVSTTRVRP
jgi:hypothetical protein